MQKYHHNSVLKYSRITTDTHCEKNLLYIWESAEFYGTMFFLGHLWLLHWEKNTVHHLQGSRVYLIICILSKSFLFPFLSFWIFLFTLRIRNGESSFISSPADRWNLSGFSQTARWKSQLSVGSEVWTVKLYWKSIFYWSLI